MQRVRLGGQQRHGACHQELLQRHRPLGACRCPVVDGHCVDAAQLRVDTAEHQARAGLRRARPALPLGLRRASVAGPRLCGDRRRGGKVLVAERDGTRLAAHADRGRVGGIGGARRRGEQGALKARVQQRARPAHAEEVDERVQLPLEHQTGQRAQQPREGLLQGGALRAAERPRHGAQQQAQRRVWRQHPRRQRAQALSEPIVVRPRRVAVVALGAHRLAVCAWRLLCARTEERQEAVEQQRAQRRRWLVRAQQRAERADGHGPAKVAEVVELVVEPPKHRRPQQRGRRAAEEVRRACVHVGAELQQAALQPRQPVDAAEPQLHRAALQRAKGLQPRGHGVRMRARQPRQQLRRGPERSRACTGLAQVQQPEQQAQQLQHRVLPLCSRLGQKRQHGQKDRVGARALAVAEAAGLDLGQLAQDAEDAQLLRRRALALPQVLGAQLRRRLADGGVALLRVADALDVLETGHVRRERAGGRGCGGGGHRPRTQR